MSGLTRAESQALTRQLIIQAATRLLLREGFRTTSLEQIGEEAGLTGGAVYSNFPTKTAMGIAVIDELYAREAERLEEADERSTRRLAMPGGRRRLAGRHRARARDQPSSRARAAGLLTRAPAHRQKQARHPPETRHPQWTATTTDLGRRRDCRTAPSRQASVRLVSARKAPVAVGQWSVP